MAEQQPTIAELWNEFQGEIKEIDEFLEKVPFPNMKALSVTATSGKTYYPDMFARRRAELLERCKPWICVQKNGNICVDVRFVPTNPDSETLRKCIAIYEFAAYLIDQKEKGVVMDDPTTVRWWLETRPITVAGWMRTLPQFENSPSWINCKKLTKGCRSLSEAISHVALNATGITAKRYWSGACDRIYCYGWNFSNLKWKAYKAGYTAMDAHLTAQKQPEPIEQAEASPTVTDGMASMPWDQYERLRIDAAAFHTSLTGDLLELQRKAAAWDSLLQTIENLKIGMKA